MNLSYLTDSKLIAQTEEIAATERASTAKLLQYLREIEARRLFSEHGYTSLFDFTVRHLKYSEDQAYRRIAAMRLLDEVPEIEKKIATGELTLTNLTLAENLFRREKKAGRSFSSARKKEFLRKIENKSSREVEKAVAFISPEMARPDQVRPLSESQIELKFSVSVETHDKIETIKGLLAHSHPEISLGELLDKLCDLQLENLQKSAPAAPRVKVRQVVDKTISRAAARRSVWQRDGGCCVKCKSRYAVELDHITPRALGGLDTPENMRLLCRKCNQRAAIRVFGQRKMDRHLRRTPR